MKDAALSPFQVHLISSNVISGGWPVSGPTLAPGEGAVPTAMTLVLDRRDRSGSYDKMNFCGIHLFL